MVTSLVKYTVGKSKKRALTTVQTIRPNLYVASHGTELKFDYYSTVILTMSNRLGAGRHLQIVCMYLAHTCT
jgi:hypothetical protein